MAKDDHTVSDKTFARYQIDSCLSLPFFVILYLTVLHELRLIALKSAPGVAANEFPATFTPNRESWIPDPLRSYFHLKKRPIFLKEKAPDHVQLALTKLLRTASDAFLADLATAGLNVGELPAAHPLKYVAHVARETAADREKATDKGLGNLLPIIVAFNQNVPLENQISYDGEKKALDLSDREFRDHFIEEFSRFVNAGRIALDPDGDGFSPDFPGIPVNSQALLKARHWGRRAIARGDKGLYYVVRQARGRRTGDAPKVDIIVRDLLWLREYDAPLDEMGMRDPYQSDKQHGARLGYYFSTIDRQFFEVTNVTKRDGIIMLDAIAPLENDVTKSLCLYFPALGQANLVSLGNMVGSVEGKRTGAWTVACFRPPEMSDDDERSLQLTLSVYSDAFCQMARKPDYDRNTRLLNQMIENKKLIGVLYTRLWADNAEPDMKKVLERRWKSFSFMFSRWDAYGEADARHAVDTILSRIKDKETGSIDESRLRDELLGLLQDEERHALTPPVSNNETRGSDRAGELSRNLAVLAERDAVPSYRAYIASTMNGSLGTIAKIAPESAITEVGAETFRPSRSSASETALD